jgi:ferredoxin-fold anticodon binding domain-containing protein
MTDHDKTGLEFKSSNLPEKLFHVSVRFVDQLDKNIILDRLNKILIKTFFLMRC